MKPNVCKYILWINTNTWIHVTNLIHESIFVLSSKKIFWPRGRRCQRVKQKVVGTTNAKKLNIKIFFIFLIMKLFYQTFLPKVFGMAFTRYCPIAFAMEKKEDILFLFLLCHFVAHESFASPPYGIISPLEPFLALQFSCDGTLHKRSYYNLHSTSKIMLME